MACADSFTLFGVGCIGLTHVYCCMQDPTKVIRRKVYPSSTVHDMLSHAGADQPPLAEAELEGPPAVRGQGIEEANDAAH